MNIHFTSTPCPEARAWLNEQPDIQTAWRSCPRGDWLWWALRHLPDALPNKEISVAFARWCTRRAKKFADAAAANIAARAYAYAYVGRATAVHAAYDAVKAAADDGDDAACAAARNAYDAAEAAAYVAAHIADVVSDDAAHAAERLEQAKWIRRHVQCPPRKGEMK